jgi:hypothetical protein
MKSLALFFAILSALLAIPLLFVESGRPPPVELPAHGLPWQIETLADGHTRVFGLEPGRSTLDAARRQYGPDVQVALMIAPSASPADSGALEAYFESITSGGVAGKMILTLATTVDQRAQMLQRARKAEYTESASRKVALGSDDLIGVGQAVISGITFIPATNLDEQIILQRFGTPAQRLRSNAKTEHFLYPDKGLEVQLNTQGKEVLQYVPPQDFARLRDPLLRLAP